METLSLDINQIQQYQKNRSPYLLIDRITELFPGKYAKGYKNLTMTEWFFPPHYPDNPMMPGLLQIEALNQMIGMCILTLPEYRGMALISLGVDHAEFIKPVVPGDRLDIEAELTYLRRGIGKGKASGFVNRILVCKTEYITSIPEVLKQFSPK
ncbi:3-hydroxyacyl-[acyl-carrier-protein] dehydratase FabZ [Spirochaetia bacterium]|nr:3-hydroxyacyl-[acyl-carrier-protein] dehydratase FabZ [Spirochaetia bacterium]